MALGRPLKGKCHRIPITVHVPYDVLDFIDERVKTIGAETGAVYSRSDFFLDAVNALLKEDKNNS